VATTGSWRGRPALGPQAHASAIVCGLIVEVLEIAYKQCGSKAITDPVGCVKKVWAEAKPILEGAAAMGKEALKWVGEKIDELKGAARRIIDDIKAEAGIRPEDDSVLGKAWDIAMAIKSKGAQVLTNIIAKVGGAISGAASSLRGIVSKATGELAGTPELADMKSACGELGPKFGAVRSQCQLAWDNFPPLNPYGEAWRATKSCIANAWETAKAAGRCAAAAAAFASHIPAAAVRAGREAAQMLKRAVAEVIERAKAKFVELKDKAVSRVKSELSDLGKRMLIAGVKSMLPELANEALDKVLQHPIVRVVAGIIPQLIDAAVQHGNKGWLTVGADVLLNIVQYALQKANPPQFFWIRALAFAKKELAHTADSTDGLKEQAKKLFAAMVGGFGAAVGRNLTGEVKESFDKGIKEIQEKVLKIEGVLEKINSSDFDPVGFLVGQISPILGKVVIPVVTSMVSMAPWVKTALQKFGLALAATEGKFDDAKKLLGLVAGVVQGAGEELLGRLPIADTDLKAFLIELFSGFVGALGAPDELKTKYLDNPCAILEKLASLATPFLKRKLTDLLGAEAAIVPERELLSRALATVLGALNCDVLRGAKPPFDAQTVASNILMPYASARLKWLAQQTGLSESALAALPSDEFRAKLLTLLPPLGGSLGGQGMDILAQFAARICRQGNWSGVTAKEILATLAQGVLPVVRELVGRLIPSVPVRDLVSGVLDGLRDLLSDPAGLGSAEDARKKLLPRLAVVLRPFLDRVLVEPQMKEGVVGGLVKTLVDKAMDLLLDPGELMRLASNSGNWKELAVSVTRTLAKGLIALVPSTALQSVFAKAIEVFPATAAGTP
jgi:hypothetical protein